MLDTFFFQVSLFISMFLNFYSLNLVLCLHLHLSIYICMYIWPHTHTHTQTHIYIYIYIYIYIILYTHLSKTKLWSQQSIHQIMTLGSGMVSGSKCHLYKLSVSLMLSYSIFVSFLSPCGNARIRSNTSYNSLFSQLTSNENLI